MKFSTKLGTANAIAHLKKHETTVVSMDKFVVRSVTISANDKSNIIDACVNLISKDLRPFATVDGEGMLDFGHAVWNLGAKYGCITRKDMADILPHSTTISNNVQKKHN